MTLATRLARAFLEADRISLKAEIHFRQMRAMARKAGEQFDDAREFAADCEAELASEMEPGERIAIGDRVLVRVDRDGFPAVEVENAVEEANVA
jgi:hypothetical protein